MRIRRDLAGFLTKSRFGAARHTDFETAMQDAVEAEAALENKRVTRDEKVAALVIAGVVGNPAYGPDSDLYGAMGYVRKSQRKSGLTQKSNVPTPAPTPAAH